MKHVLLLLLFACFSALGAGRNFGPRVTITNSVDLSLVFQGLPSVVSAIGDGHKTNFIDSTSYRNNATNTAALQPVYYDNAMLLGKKSLYFDGSTWLRLPVAANLDITGGQITLMAWVNVDSQVTSQIVIGGYDTNTINGYALGLNISGSQRVEYFDDYLGGTWRINTTGYSLNTWFHITATASNALTKSFIYVNAGTPAVDANGPINSWSGQRAIGADSFGAVKFKGYMRDVRIYNRVLSSNEIYNIYIADLD